MKRTTIRGASAVGLLSLLSSVFAVPVGTGMATAAPAASSAFSMATNPPLDPAFTPYIVDYVVPCTGSPTTNLTTTGSGPVTIAGSGLQSPVNLNLPLVAGQEVEVTHSGRSYFIRCTPSDFHAYTSTVTGTPQASGYLLAVGNYAVVFDPHGVPVWWYKDPNPPFTPINAKFLNPTTIAWWSDFPYRYEIRNLDGALTHTVGGASVALDPHDLWQLPNGNYLGIEDKPGACCVDLSSWGRSAQSSFQNADIVELNGKNQIAWKWSVANHIDLATANVNWRDQGSDLIHMNSIQYDGHGGIIFSARHLDAIYRINMATGNITWKLGGSPTSQSLTVVGDQYVDHGGQLFSGQHDARLQPDGTLTVHDNGTRAARAPRALRFTIDTSTHTATEVKHLTDPRASYSGLVGSVEPLPGGDWVIQWGGKDFMTELSSHGIPQITITYPGYIPYREADVMATIPSLRKAMNAMVAPLNRT